MAGRMRKCSGWELRIGEYRNRRVWVDGFASKGELESVGALQGGDAAMASLEVRQYDVGALSFIPQGAGMNKVARRETGLRGILRGGWRIRLRLPTGWGNLPLCRGRARFSRRRFPGVGRSV